MNRRGKEKERETRVSRGKATGRDQGSREPSKPEREEEGEGERTRVGRGGTKQRVKWTVGERKRRAKSQ